MKILIVIIIQIKQKHKINFIKKKKKYSIMKQQIPNTLNTCMQANFKINKSTNFNNKIIILLIFYLNLDNKMSSMSLI